MKLYLLFWCQQPLLLRRIENQLQAFVSVIFMLCNEKDNNLPYSDNSSWTFFPARNFETKKLDVNELYRWLNTEIMHRFNSIVLKVYGCQTFDLQKFYILSGGLRFWKIKNVDLNKYGHGVEEQWIGQGGHSTWLSPPLFMVCYYC